MNEETVTQTPQAGVVTAVHHLGYREWKGLQAPAWLGFIAITEVGVRRSWENKWLKRILSISLLPVIGFATVLFIFEQAAISEEWRTALAPAVRDLPSDPVSNEIRSAYYAGDLGRARHTVWAYLLMCFFRYSQPIGVVLMIGMVAPALISQDLRSRAFLLYFSRPMSRIEYVLGKMLTVWVYLALILTIPALVLYGFCIALSPGLNIVLGMWDIPLRIFAASIILMLPTSALSLCFSSLSQESRQAVFAWFAVWILGWFTYNSVAKAEGFEATQQAQRHRSAQQMIGQVDDSDLTVETIPESPWIHLSLYHTLGRVQNWVFGFSRLSDVIVSIIILVGITLTSLAVLYRRISAPMQV